MNSFDVIICGGGPSGASCALALAGSGLSVAVIDKAIFPRSKICGDAVAAYVPKVLAAIDPKWAEAIRAFDRKTPVDTCRVVAPNGKFLDMQSSEMGFIATRMELDNYLFKMASGIPNIHWYLDTEITSVNVDKLKQEVVITCEKNVFTSKIIIGCDGAHSLVSKKLANNTTELKHHAAAVRGYYKNVSAIPARTYELHFLKGVLPGYFWIFPLPGNLSNVGLCIPSHVVSKKKINLRSKMEEIIREYPSIKTRFENASLVNKIEGFGLPLATRKITVSGDHFMLCGDAASLIDPATGEGIGQAIISGRYAGWQAIECFKRNDFSASFMLKYKNQLYKKLWGDARKSKMIQNYILNNERLLNASTNLLANSNFLKKFVFSRIMKVKKPGKKDETMSRNNVS